MNGWVLQSNLLGLYSVLTLACASVCFRLTLPGLSLDLAHVCPRMLQTVAPVLMLTRERYGAAEKSHIPLPGLFPAQVSHMLEGD